MTINDPSSIHTPSSQNPSPCSSISTHSKNKITISHLTQEEMGTFLSPNGTTRSVPCQPLVGSGVHHSSSVKSCFRCHQLGFRNASVRRNFMYSCNSVSRSSRIIVSAKKKVGSSDRENADDQSREKEEELMAAKKALAEAKARQEAIEKERDRLLEELSRSDATRQSYIAAAIHDKELALTELKSAKSMFHQKLKETDDEKSTLESRLVLVRQDSVELAVQVEKLAEISFQRATSQVLEDAELRVSAAETSAAEAARTFEEQIRNATEATIVSFVEQSKDAIEKALLVAERASDYATNAVAAFSDVINPSDEIASIQSAKFKLQDVVSNLESQLLLTKQEVDKLKSELAQAREQASESESRANNVEKALSEFQESSGKRVLEQEQEITLFLEKMKEEAEEKKKIISETFKTDLDGIKAAIDAAKQTSRSKDDAYVRRCEALQRSLKAAEGVKSVWKKRAEVAETLLLKKAHLGEREEDAVYMVNGGRIDLLTDDDHLKWKLLSDGPRREIPQWMARKIRSISPRFPPRKVDVSEALKSKFTTLDLPKPDDVWSIAREKPREGDAINEHVFQKEKIEKKREDLENNFKEKTDQWVKTPEQKKSESGTGTGHEIVFQGFNWESWRRQWYMEVAAKAADLAKVGISSVWLPPPTESVAPQGYMPSDLYNLNSAYGTIEELKHCIKEMHAHGLLVLGDVVLNHRCAHKQSPNGVWNIFGGKLSWGPEAIVCDDPNFQGRGNPSSGDIFHAAPNVDHSQEFVRKDIKEWLLWLKKDIGFDGWRLDFVRGFSGTYVKEYIQVSEPAFAIGEYWDSLAYENGDLCYNQDAHRQRIVNWINATNGTSSAFDVTTKGILHSALHNQYWRLIDPLGKPPGVMGWWPSRAVTFLENHDTGSTQGHWPFPRDKLTQGYAYILTHPGTPAVFYDHLYDFGIRDVITELIEIRKKADINCRSAVKILHANNEGYVAHVNKTLVMKMGHFDWNPSKELHLDGSWARSIDKGADYQIWLRQ